MNNYSYNYNYNAGIHDTARIPDLYGLRTQAAETVHIISDTMTVHRKVRKYLPTALELH